MRHLFFVSLILTVFIACKNDGKQEQKEDLLSNENAKTAKQSDGLTLLKGEFVYYDGAAVLQTHSEIYGVLINDKLEALDTQAAKYKNQPTDMVQVEIRGKISNKKDDKILWENKVEIMEVLSVKPITKNNVSTLNLGKE